MKKLLTLVGIFAFFMSFGQTTSLVWDIESHFSGTKLTGDPCCWLAGSVYIAEVSIPWYGTHGCINPCLCIEDERKHLLIDAFNTGTPSGRGFAIQYNWKAGYRYTISIDGSISDELVYGEQRPYRPPTMQVGFTNSINIQNNLCTGVGVGVVDISTLTSPMATFTSTLYTVTMDLNECKQYLWFSAASNPAGENSGAIRIRKLTIDETLLTPLTISGSGIFCGSSSVYTINGTLPGSSVSWSMLGPQASAYTVPLQSVATLNQNGTSVTVNKTANGNFTLVATVTEPCGTIRTVTKAITMGTPSVYMNGGYATGTNPYQPISGTINFVNNKDVWASLAGYPNTSFTWTKNSSVGTVNWSILTFPSQKDVKVTFQTPVSSGNRIDFTVQSSNSCGTRTDPVVFYYNGPPVFMVRPNAAASEINVASITSSREQEGFGRIQVLDQTGRVLIDKHYPSNTIKANIAIAHLHPDIYIVRVMRNKQVEVHKVIVQR